MSITVTCDSCGAVLRTKDTMAGKTAKCPHCGDPVQIPAAHEDEIYEAEEVGGAGGLGGGDEFGGGGGGGDFDFDGFDTTAGRSGGSDRKPCPACGEMIMRKAAKCRYCGEIFDPSLRRRSQGSRSRSRYNDEDADLSGGEWAVAILCSSIGCIIGIVWMIQGKPKGAKMFGMSLLFAFLWGAVRVLIEAAGR